MTFYQQLATKTVPWPGVLDVSLLPKTAVAAGHRLADAAKTGDWPVVMKLLDDEKVLVPHQWRPGGKAWFTILASGGLARLTSRGRRHTDQAGRATVPARREGPHCIRCRSRARPAIRSACVA